MIEQKHQIPLTQAVNASTPGRGAVAEALYAEAHALLLNKPMQGSRSIRNRDVKETRTGNIVTATALDHDSGIYVQLTAVMNKKDEVIEGPFLTYGKKYLLETQSPQLSNNAVKLWR